MTVFANTKLRKNSQGTVEGGDEEVYFITSVVEAEGDADGAGDTEVVDKGFGAVVADTDGYALLVEQRTEVKGMNEFAVDIVDIERQHTGFG